MASNKQMERKKALEQGLPDEFLLLKTQLQQWIWKSKEGRQFIDYLCGWQRRHPDLLADTIEPNNNAQLETALRVYFEQLNLKEGVKRWIYGLLNPVTTAEEIEEGLYLFFATSTALDTLIYQPLFSKIEQSTGTSNASPSTLVELEQKEAAAHRREIHRASLLEAIIPLRPSSKLHAAKLSDEILSLHAARFWFNALRKKVHKIWTAIKHQSAENREAMAANNAANQNDLVEEQTLSSLPASVCLQNPTPSLMACRNEIATAKQALALQVSELFNVIDTAVEGIPFSKPRDEDAPHDWEQRIIKSIRKNETWGWLKGAGSSEFSEEQPQREYLLCQSLIQGLSAIESLIVADAPIELKELQDKIDVLLKLLQDASFLEENKAFSFLWHNRVSSTFWDTVNQLRSTLLQFPDSQNGAHRELERLFIGLEHPINTRHRRIITEIYRYGWPACLERYNQWKQARQKENTPAMEAKKELLEVKLEMIATALYKATQVLTEEEAETYRWVIGAQLQNFDALLLEEKIQSVELNLQQSKYTKGTKENKLPTSQKPFANLLLSDDEDDESQSFVDTNKPDFVSDDQIEPPSMSSSSYSSSTEEPKIKSAIPVISTRDALTAEEKQAFYTLGYKEDEEVPGDAFRRHCLTLFKTTHPDKNPEQAEQFKRYKEARDILQKIVERVCEKTPTFAEWLRDIQQQLAADKKAWDKRIAAFDACAKRIDDSCKRTEDSYKRTESSYKRSKKLFTTAKEMLKDSALNARNAIASSQEIIEANRQQDIEIDALIARLDAQAALEEEEKTKGFRK